MVETLVASGEFERKPPHEVERKYLPIFPDQLEQFRESALPVEQFYLSHPDEMFSLRLRETCDEHGALHYEAALKDKGEMTDAGLDRVEVPADISPATYRAYFDEDKTPWLRKLRAEPSKHIAIDFFEDGHIQAEAEDATAWRAFCDRHRLNDSFVDITGDKLANNEFRAHFQFRQRHGGKEALGLPAELDTGKIAEAIWRRHHTSHYTVATIAGRSGSGKTTVIRDIQQQLEQNGVRSIVLSTDDYHRGKSWLESYKGGEWTDWDAPIVYDIKALQADVRWLWSGETIAKQWFDFETSEPAYGGVLEPAPVILIEGIYARHSSFSALTDLRFELPTPLATCIGRRLLRDLKERPVFADPSKSLKYMLENAELAYRDQITSEVAKP
jgi:uridine kinase